LKRPALEAPAFFRVAVNAVLLEHARL